MKIRLLSANDPNWTNKLAELLDECEKNDILILPDNVTCDLARSALHRRQDHKYIRIMTMETFGNLQRDSGEDLEAMIDQGA